MTQPQRRILLLSASGFFVVQLDLFIVNVAFRSMQRSFPGVGLARLSWVLNAYAIVYAGLLVSAGMLADRVGRRRVFLGGLSLFTLASVLCSAAPSADPLIAARVLQAIGAALVTPASLGLVLTEIPRPHRAAAVGIWVGAGGVAAAGGPSLGGLLVGETWRLVFLVNLPVGVLAVGWGSRLLRGTREEAAAGWPDFIGSGLLSLGVAALVLALVQGPSWHWESGRTLASVTCSILLITVFAARSARHPRPVLDPHLLRRRSFSFACLASLFYALTFAGSLTAAVVYLSTVWRRSPVAVGALITPGPVLVASLSFYSARLARRVQPRYLIAGGSVILACGCAWWAAMMSPGAAPWPTFVPGWVMAGIGIGLSVPNMMSSATGSIPAASFSTGSAVVTMCRQIGAALGVAAFVAILGHPRLHHATAAFVHCWIFLAASACACSLCGLAIGDVERRRANEEAHVARAATLRDAGPHPLPAALDCADGCRA